MMGDNAGRTGPFAAGPPGAADVVIGFGQQPAPLEGYSLEAFDRRLTEMAEQELALVEAGDYRGVFHLTYATFSRRIRAALAASRFADARWAEDMSCRFVDAYLEQVRRWERDDASQCRAWRAAFGAAQSGRANVLQAMFLGMNAHIHYDLAFVTLGACRAAGDLAHDASEQALRGARSGLPAARYRDFLLINQVAWESIPHIQETVLSAFSRPLRWANQPVARLTKTFGQQLLMEARDTSWAHTCLLVHARDEVERMAVAEVIDAHAASHIHLVEMLTVNPARLAAGARRWRDRGIDLTDAARDQLVRMATTNPIVAELALRQLAFAGADPAVVVDALVDAGRVQLAGVLATMVIRHAPKDRRKDLQRYWGRPDRRPRAALEEVLLGVDVPASTLPRSAVTAVHDSWQRSAEEAGRCAAVPEVATAPGLLDALHRHEQRLRDRLGAAGQRERAPDRATLTLAQAQALLAGHPDPWVRACATGIERPEGGPAVTRIVEQVLFLKSTTLFIEVDPAQLLPVAEELETRTFAPEALIISEGEPVDGIHLVTHGRVRVSRMRGGNPVVVAELGPGDSLGELSALNDTTATADCTAVTPVETAFLPGRVLAALLHQHPRIAIGLVRVLSQRLMATSRLLAGT